MPEDFSSLNRLRATFSTASPPYDPGPPPGQPPAPTDRDTIGFPSLYGVDADPDPWFTPSLAEVVAEADEPGAGVVVNVPYFPEVPDPPKPEHDQPDDDQPDDEGAQ